MASARAVTTKGAKPLMAFQVEHAHSRPELTERQRQVAQALERGLSNDEIAAELGISPRTVKAHCDALRVKLGVSKRRLIVPALRELEGRA
jgi:DNA-binding NarL/FixJ family response regulator